MTLCGLASAYGGKEAQFMVQNETGAEQNEDESNGHIPVQLFIYDYHRLSPISPSLPKNELSLLDRLL